jgi:hypothetical protein
MDRTGTNKTHNNEHQADGWFRTDKSGFTFYKKGDRAITKNHKTLFGNKYHADSTKWVMEMPGYVCVFHTLKAAKELKNWRACIVEEPASE